MTDKPVTNEDIAERLGRIEGKLDEMKPMLQAWNAAVTGSKFVKWLAGLIAALIAAWVAIRNLLH